MGVGTTDTQGPAHRALTTSAHGGIVASNDSRLTNARTPSGAAGGVLAGTFPNPTFAADMATQAELDTHAATSSNIHGIPSLAAGDKGKGLIWNGSTWVAASDFRVNAQVGFWAPTTRHGFTASTLASQLLTLCRFVAPYDMTVTRLGFVVSTLDGNDDPVALAIFSSDGATRHCTTGNVTGRLTTTGMKSIATTSSYQLTAGTVYYAGFLATITGTPQFVKADMLNGFVPEAFGTTISGTDVVTGQLGTWDGCQVVGAGASMPSSLTGVTRSGAPVAITVRAS